MKLRLVNILLLTIALLHTPASSVSAGSYYERPSPPSRRAVEAVLGQPVECPPRVGEGVCYKQDDILVLVRFNSVNVADSVSLITSCVGIQSLNKFADRIVPADVRGKHLRRVEKSRPSDCEKRYAEEYEHLTMECAERLCQDCSPAAIKISWV